MSEKPHWSQASPQWWEAWPLPKSEAPRVDAGEVMRLLEQQPTERDFLLVDVRRSDWEGGAITTSINLPAHAFYQSRGMVYDLCRRANIKRIIFFCRSSNGRGPRCAAWMQDYISEADGGSGGGLEAVVMDGGVSGWAKTYGGRMMDWYDEDHWKGVA
ncbi:hypothetical protein NKR23_g10574 [Pleurostoma richardsiae]|uniref:Rhodanese domain-containing protein n=1 Tax=Pleurostoma richardsiae TaxID=41990 RepID=A0AA38RJU4_9PEZI|nr:hypothetical protein NKR23_g10574 [Pleurostoma richardsiae]